MAKIDKKQVETLTIVHFAVHFAQVKYFPWIFSIFSSKLENKKFTPLYCIVYTKCTGTIETKMVNTLLYDVQCTQFVIIKDIAGH